MLLVVLSVIVALAATMLSVLHRRAVASALSPASRELVPKLLRTPREDRPGLLAEASTEGSWEAQLAEALTSAPSEPLRAAAANEALGDLELLFSSRARWSPSAIRIALLGGLLLGALALIRGEWVLAIVAVGICALGAGVCAALSSNARDLEKAQRKLADELVDAVVPGLPRAEPAGRRFKDVW